MAVNVEKFNENGIRKEMCISTFVETRLHEYKDESCHADQDRKAY